QWQGLGGPAVILGEAQTAWRSRCRIRGLQIPGTPQIPSRQPWGVPLAPIPPAGRYGVGGAREPELRLRGRSLPPDSSPSRPPPSSQLLLGLQLRPRLPLPEPPPRSGAHRRASLPSPPWPSHPARTTAPGGRPPASLPPSCPALPDPPKHESLPIPGRPLPSPSHRFATAQNLEVSLLCRDFRESQVLFAVVFTARYLDLFTNYISLYNTCMKVVYIACSFTTVWMIYSKFKATYDGNHDTFRVEFLVVPTAILAFWSTMTLRLWRSSGPSPSTWSRWPSCRSCSW
uniref:Uncharacterized protein n=1 Tax=Lynx canadensis TaxID=61383 RepID=A0A667HLS1_LYNCA